MENIVPFIKPKEPIPRCSFCDTLKTEALTFFASDTGHYICGQCVTHAKKRLEEEA